MFSLQKIKHIFITWQNINTTAWQPKINDVPLFHRGMCLADRPWVNLHALLVFHSPWIMMLCTMLGLKIKWNFFYVMRRAMIGCGSLGSPPVGCQVVPTGSQLENSTELLETPSIIHGSSGCFHCRTADNVWGLILCLKTLRTRQKATHASFTLKYSRCCPIWVHKNFLIMLSYNVSHDRHSSEPLADPRAKHFPNILFKNDFICYFSYKVVHKQIHHAHCDREVYIDPYIYLCRWIDFFPIFILGLKPLFEVRSRVGYHSTKHVHGYKHHDIKCCH